MGKNHLKRIAAPKNWSVARKESKWIARPLPGKHKINNCITVSFMLRNILNYAKTSKEIKKILNDGNFIVDKKITKDQRISLGLMDVIQIPKLNENYRLLYNIDGRLNAVPIEEKESNLKLLKIIRKKTVKKGKIQITFHDGRTISLDKFDGKIGDTALFNFENKNITKFMELNKGAAVYFNGGAHIGSIGEVKEIIIENKLSKPKVLVEINGKEYTTLKDYAFVVGKDKPEIKIKAEK